jgi:6-pyruvoyltetrahydropterin/6-carboxytetrahydropterin synthase
MLEVTVDGEIDRETGYVMDFGDLKRAIQENVVRHLDRRHLNFDVDFLRGVNPTAENIAVGILRQLESKVSPARLVRITLDETEKNRVVYEGGRT